LREEPLLREGIAGPFRDLKTVSRTAEANKRETLHVKDHFASVN
jgi:hypothetical protein